jgi:hypothetical protein
MNEPHAPVEAEAEPPDDTAKAKLRRQALDGMKAGLTRPGGRTFNSAHLHNA